MEIQLAPESAPEEGDASADTPAGLWFPLVVKPGQCNAPEIDLQ